MSINSSQTSYGAKPPHKTYNMGGSKGESSYSFDWISMTWKDLPGVRDHLLSLLGGDGKWIPISGMHGYKRGVQRGAYRLYDEGNGTVYLELRGEGCRQLASEKNLVTESDWQEWFAKLAEFGGRATRIDVAIDDHRDLVRIETIVRKVLRGHLTTSFRTRETYTVLSRKTGRQQVSGVRFGGRHSDRKLLIYDKAFESGSDGQWLRIEYQARDATARALLLEFSKVGFDSVTEDIRARLTFRVAPRGGEKVGTVVQNECRWWNQMMGTRARELKPKETPRLNEITDEQLLPLRALLARAYEQGGVIGIRNLVLRCARLADKDHRTGTTGHQPKSRGGRWSRHVRLWAARKAAEKEDQVLGLG